MVTRLLEQAFAEAAELPEQEQNSLATIILKELAAERRWEKVFAGSEDALAELADEALDDFREGRSPVLGPDEL
jgi:urease gamma subunit